MLRISKVTTFVPFRPVTTRVPFRTSRRRRHRSACCLVACRWGFFAAGMILFAVRIYTVNGFYLVTFALATGLLNNLVGLFTPQVCPAKPFIVASNMLAAARSALLSRRPPPPSVVLHFVGRRSLLYGMIPTSEGLRRDYVQQQYANKWRRFENGASFAVRLGNLSAFPSSSRFPCN